jgi:hydroxymethylglutaryl-CoA synthase
VHGLLSHGAYVPIHRLPRATVSDALGGGPRSGARAVAAFDQDATCLGVEAARRALAGHAPGAADVLFATSSPVYAERTNATAIHAALDLARSSSAVDLGSSPRSAVAALRMAARSPGPALAVLADLRGGVAGSADEALGGDAGAALLFGDGDPVAVLLGEAAVTHEFLDRWRTPGAPFVTSWDERFGAGVYGHLVDEAVRAALADAGLERADHVVVSSPHRRAAAAARKRLGGAPGWIDEDVGYAGAADLGLRLSDALAAARPGDTVLVVSAADGADALVLGVRRPSPPPADGPRSPRREISYATFLTWRGRLDREQPRRPDPDKPAAPPASRNTRWKFGFVGSACESCGAVHLPPQRVCLACHAVDRMRARVMQDATGRISTYTIDRLAPSLDPPVVDVIVDFDGGGRFSCQLTEADPGAVRIGDRVAMTFRRVFAFGGITNYFWKARPLAAPESAA